MDSSSVSYHDCFEIVFLCMYVARFPRMFSKISLGYRTCLANYYVYTCPRVQNRRRGLPSSQINAAMKTCLGFMFLTLSADQIISHAC